MQDVCRVGPSGKHLMAHHVGTDEDSCVWCGVKAQRSMQLDTDGQTSLLDVIDITPTDIIRRF